VLSARRLKEQYGVGALDVAKRLLDFGVHPPTVYFPLIVPEALMIEPTETESRETLDRFAAVLGRIAREAAENPELLRQAPTRTPVERIDEVLAAKHPVVRWTRERGDRT
jgi:glycine dehydrogenase subunit 2